MAGTSSGEPCKSLGVLWVTTLQARQMLRCFVSLAAALLLAAAPAIAQDRIRLGLLKFGTASWTAEIIAGHGLDKANGFVLERLDLASNDAARIAFLAGEADVIVSDLLFAARLTAEGKPVVFVPFSSAEASLMTASGSPIHSIGDLRGRRIGVSGGPLDKGWLMLLTEAKRAHGLDLARDAAPVFGAPPLLQQQLEAGELDAALLYWNFAARLKAKGYREVTSVEQLARNLGASGNVSMIGFILHKPFAGAHPAAVNGFAAAVRSARDVLAKGGQEWEQVRPLMRAADEATFQALKQGFLAGQVRRPPSEEEADARRLFKVLAAIGGEKLAGPARELPPGLYFQGQGNGF
jgi:NitT/TauT family transport system substrate-binding protein